MIHSVNYLITKLFDIILYPFNFLPDFWGVLFLSILVSLVVLVVYKYVSSPAKIKETKNRIKSSILAIRLYKDFWRVIGASFLKSLAYTGKYFFLNFGPILLIIPILFPVLAQMDARYGMRPFEKGETFALMARFNQNPKQLKVTLLENKGAKPTMNPVFINAFKDEERTLPIREVNWKLTATADGATDLEIEVDGQVLTKSLVVGPHRGALSNKKFRTSNLAHFLYPAEERFDSAVYVDEVSIRYPGKNVTVFGLPIHWLLLHLVLVVFMVLGLRKRFGVEF
jgi:hypothetical protein